uniref:TNFAIP3-interacting protein 2 n=1 Tax=Latimeria chalumnae TaxID=7897 RepID=H3B6S4_LATCH
NNSFGHGAAKGEGKPRLALEEALEKVQRENRALKTKLQGYSTLSTFYHEARQQVQKLGSQLAAKDAALEELRSRLARYESLLAATGQPAPANQLHFGPSRSLVESLVEQLNEVKEQHRESQRTDHIPTFTLSKEVEKLQQQLREKERELQRILNMPQCEKDLEIVRLRRSLAEKERLQATREVLCRSLTDEKEELRFQLAATAKMCQQLSQWLEQKQQPTLEEQMQTEPSFKCTNLESSQLRTMMCKIQEENKVLKQKVIHVEDLNAKWQKYDASREEYVKGLHQQLKELKTQKEQQHVVGPVKTNVELMQQEILRLNRLLQEKMKECSRLKRELEDEMKASGEDRERIEMLQQQVIVYRDDFRSERKDRERAQSKIQELQEEIVCLQQQLAQRQEVRESGGLVRVHIGNHNHMHIETDTMEPLLGNSPDQSGSKGVNNHLESAEAAAPGGSSGSKWRTEGVLQCPGCMRMFNDELDEEFFKHISECCH